MYHPIKKKSVVRNVLREVDDLGHIKTSAIEREADRIGCNPKTIRRWVRDSGWRPPTGDLPPELVGAVLHQYAGNVSAAYRLLSDAGVDGLMSESSFRRWVDRELPESLAYAKDGKAGLENKTVYATFKVKRRNDVWQGDHTKLGIFVTVPGRNKPVRPWLTTFQDAKTRMVLGYAVTTGSHPNSEVIAATLARAVKVRPTYRRGTEIDGGDIGGVPRRIRHDHGADWTSNRVKDVLLAFDIDSDPTPRPYSAHHNGRAERWHRTVNEGFCAVQPGYSKLIKNLEGGRKYRGSDKDLLPFAEFRERLDQWVQTYNTRTHRSLGNSPFDEWRKQSQVPLRAPSADAVRFAMLDGGTRIVQKYGIEYERRRFVSGALPPPGTQVQVRHVAYEYSTIEVYDTSGNWLCTAEDTTDGLSDSMLEELAQTRTAKHSQARKQAALGHKMRRGDVEFGGLSTVADLPPDDDEDDDDGPWHSPNGRGSTPPPPPPPPPPAVSDEQLDDALRGI